MYRIMKRLALGADCNGLWRLPSVPLYTWSDFCEPMPKEPVPKSQTSSHSQFASYPSLRNRAVLITGGATGIGESLVSHFARQGSRVAFLDIQDEPGQKLVESLGREGCPKPHFLHCDLADISALQTAVKRVLNTLGTVDVLVNNAANDQRHTIEDVTPEFWDNSIALNLRPHFFMHQAILPAMRAAGRGSIINMSSISLDDPVDRRARLRHRQGCNRRADADAGT